PERERRELGTAVRPTSKHGWKHGRDDAPAVRSQAQSEACSQADSQRVEDPPMKRFALTAAFALLLAAAPSRAQGLIIIRPPEIVPGRPLPPPVQPLAIK